MSQENSNSTQSKNQPEMPISRRGLTRVLVLIIIVLAFVAAYYQSAYRLEKKRYQKLEDKYVRVRDVLGREETQKIIDQSRQQDNY